MEKLVEREAADGAAGRAPALAVQFFLIPMGVVALTVLVYAGFRMLLSDDRTAAAYLNDIRAGGTTRRWQAAFELSELMANERARAREKTLAPQLIKAFDDAERDDPRVRRYLALALGRLGAPQATPALVKALNDADSETVLYTAWALGAIGAPEATAALIARYSSDDSGIRKMVVYALGAIPGDHQRATLLAALNDAVPDVQWNAALALARHGDRGGVRVISRMLDRDYVTRNTRVSDDGVAAVIVGALQAVAGLRDVSFRDRVRALAEQDPSLRVRQAALDASRALH